MSTVTDILRQSGFSDQEIEKLDTRAITAFSGVLSTAEQQRQEAAAAREQAELAQRSNADFYETRIVPALTGWDSEREQIEAARAEAERQAAFYRGAAREAGILPADEPARANGGYVAGVNGSPTFQPEEIIKRAGDGLATIADIDWKYRSLFDGKPLPISPSQLIKEADALKISPIDYAD